MKKSQNQSLKTPSTSPGLVAPATKTLDKYGLSLLDWVRLAASHPTPVCAICLNLPKSGKLVIDHEHVKDWKKLPPEKRKQYVRGLLCWRCNYHFAGKGMTVDRAKNLLEYLRRYEMAKFGPEAYLQISG